MGRVATCSYGHEKAIGQRTKAPSRLYFVYRYTVLRAQTIAHKMGVATPKEGVSHGPTTSYDPVLCMKIGMRILQLIDLTANVIVHNLDYV